MREETHNLTEWMELGQELGRPNPSIASALGEVPETKTLPAVTRNMFTLMEKAREAIKQIQEDWNEGTFFAFHLLGNHSLFLLPRQFEKMARQKVISWEKIQELKRSLNLQFAEQEKCAAALGLPGSEELPDALLKIYGNNEAMKRAMLTISIMVGTRVMIEELLTLLNNPDFQALPNVRKVAESPLTLNLFERHDRSLDEWPGFDQM